MMPMLDEDRDNMKQFPEKNTRALATLRRLQAMPSPVERFRKPVEDDGQQANPDPRAAPE